MAAKPEHYVNNKDFLEALVIWKAKVKRAAEAGEPKPQITNYIGSCFLKIANHYHTDQTLSTICSKMI